MTHEPSLFMPRRRVAGCGGFVFHVMNRSAKQLTLFEAPDDYELFLQVLVDAEGACPIRLLEYCVIPNHWHLLVWPERDDELSHYMRWITGVHGQRWRRAVGLPGKGAVYEGRYRWVAVQDGDHYEVARRYIQQNPVRAGLVEEPDQWPWSSASLAARQPRPTLHCGPQAQEAQLDRSASRALDADTAQRMRESLRNGQPFGEVRWSRALEVRTWLTAVLEAHSKAQKAIPQENTNKVGPPAEPDC